MRGDHLRAALSARWEALGPDDLAGLFGASRQQVGESGLAATPAFLMALYQALEIDIEFLVLHPEALACSILERYLLGAGLQDPSFEALRGFAGRVHREAGRAWLCPVLALRTPEDPGSVGSPRFSPDGSLFLLESTGQFLQVWQLPRGTLLWRAATTDITSCGNSDGFSFSADSRYLLTSGVDYAGMTDWNDYGASFDARTGALVHYSDNYGTKGTPPEGVVKADSTSPLSAKRDKDTDPWILTSGEAEALLPPRYTEVAGAPNGVLVAAVPRTQRGIRVPAGVLFELRR